jgi:VanZ family protein
VSPEFAPGLAWDRPAVGAVTAWWATVAVYAGVIFVMSSTAHPLGIQRLPPGGDKVLHAAMFGGLSLTVWKALRCSAPRVSSIRLSMFAVLIATLYGLSDEFHQSFVPGREMDVVDWVADWIGACVVQGMIVMRSVVSRREPSGSAR